MKYTIKNFRREFNTEDRCLEYVFKFRYPQSKHYHKVRGRKCYAHSFTAKQIHPLAGTIFHKSSTPLTVWFEAIYLFSISKNGVSAKELQRHFGFTYKTAWRIGHQVRKLMTANGPKLSGIVEADETYVGGYKKGGQGGKGKTPILGIVERGGAVRAKVSERQTHRVLDLMRNNVERGSRVLTDQYGVYRKALKLGYSHDSVNHWKKEFARGDVHTNTIEGFWSQLKRSLHGTYHAVSPKHLQAYVDEFAFRYSFRDLSIFDLMLRRI